MPRVALHGPRQTGEPDIGNARGFFLINPPPHPPLRWLCAAANSWPTLPFITNVGVTYSCWVWRYFSEPTEAFSYFKGGHNVRARKLAPEVPES